MTTPACMGGWCHVRDRCALHLQADRREPAERVCGHGRSDAFTPIVAWGSKDPAPIARPEYENQQGY